tara:strand:- start:849 stop:1517 length:669 start_codon:yes stop_codon:yes gene_type:complete
MKVGDSTEHRYGTPRIAKDGVKYRSTFEADFVNKYLYRKGIKYEYEKKYPGTKQMCDFYLTDLGIWLELVYHGVEIKYSYQENELWQRIYLPRASYTDKNYIKKCGGNWDPDRREWYVFYSGRGNLMNLEQWMDKEDLRRSIHSDGKGCFKKYDENLTRKIAEQSLILVVTHDDMKKSSLHKIILSKKSRSCNMRIMSEYFKVLEERFETNKPDMEVLNESR